MPRSPFSDDIADARARAGAQYRRLGHALVGRLHDVDVLDELTATLAGWSDRLEADEPRDRVIERPTGDWGPAPADGEEMFSFDDRPISGRSAPWGIDLRVVRDGEEAVGYVTLGPSHEGAPARSHGGVVAALFDDVFGFVLTIHEQPAFTGELTIRYLAGTPIGVPLECRVRLTGRDGRKLFMGGELTSVAADGTTITYATSTATFIGVAAEQFSVRR